MRGEGQGGGPGLWRARVVAGVGEGARCAVGGLGRGRARAVGAGEAEGGQKQVKQAEQVCGAGRCRPMAADGLADRGRIRVGWRGQVRSSGLGLRNLLG